MKYLLIVFALLFSVQTFAGITTILDVTGSITNQISTENKVPGLQYSVQCDISGTTFDIDITLQSSVDGSVWTDLGGFTTNFISTDTLLMDVSGGSHFKTRLNITRNSGTYNLKCKLKN